MQAATTYRKYDFNGWPEIRDNPISKTGVFPYLGRQIDDSLEPNKIYYVYRPADELSDPECIDSFKLVPWIDDHVMLGNAPDLTAPEQKGISGVTGENVYYDSKDGKLKANLKLFSSDMLSKIDDAEKKELSIGYRCLYEKESGVYNGQRYDFVQRKIRGNHLALVDEGRAGPDVAVLDHFKFTFDGSIAMPDENKEKTKESQDAAIANLSTKVDACMDMCQKIMDRLDAKDEADPAMLVTKSEATDEDKDKDDDKKDEGKAMDSQLQKLQKDIKALETKTTAAAMDSKKIFSEISCRDALAAKLSQVIGTFDHSAKTLQEVAEYGVEKLKLNVAKGNEVAVLDGYFAGRKESPAVVEVEDARTYGEDDQIDKYLRGE